MTVPLFFPFFAVYIPLLFSEIVCMIFAACPVAQTIVLKVEILLSRVPKRNVLGDQPSLPGALLPDL
jgi:hypothetical protein